MLTFALQRYNFILIYANIMPEKVHFSSFLVIPLCQRSFCRRATFLVRVAHESDLALMAIHKWLRVPSYLFNVNSVLFYSEQRSSQ